MVTVANRTFYARTIDFIDFVNPIHAFKHCCALGMKLFEPATLADMKLALNITGRGDLNVVLGDTEFINQSHEVWCRSRTILQDSFYEFKSNWQRYPSVDSIIGMFVKTPAVIVSLDPVLSLHELFINQTKQAKFGSFICEHL
ncbi:uncharacterized protein LOC135934145 [Cloeon dipterum]|uniref:uncharacterized protein LOC135934145 n=1 Tax=Cloeon dipterum TaxID=197152 RepID=UPI00322050E5